MCSLNAILKVYSDDDTPTQITVLFGLFQKTSKDNAIALNFSVDQIQVEAKWKPNGMNTKEIDTARAQIFMEYFVTCKFYSSVNTIKKPSDI